MSFEFLDLEIRGLNITVRAFFIILFITFLLFSILLWAFGPKPEPVIVEGYLEGVYDAKVEWFDG